MNEPADEDDDLTPEEEDEIIRRAEEAEEEMRTGKTIPHSALFPPKRLAG
jgi:hypothetical protein